MVSSKSQASPGPSDDERRAQTAADADRLALEHAQRRQDDHRRVPIDPQAPVAQPFQRRTTDPTFRPDRAPGPGERPALPTPPRSGNPLPAPPRTGNPLPTPPRTGNPAPPRPAPAVDDPSARPPPGAADAVAVEVEELARRVGLTWSRFSIADRISVAAALTTFGGTLLPWQWHHGHEVVLGIASGGVLHAAIAVVALWLLARRDDPGADERGMRLTTHKQAQRTRRTSLLLLLLSLASTVAGTWLLLAYGAIRRFEVPGLEVGAGLYLTLAAGLGLSYSGLSHFQGAARRRLER